MLGLFVKKHILSLLPFIDPVVLYIHADDHLTGRKFETIVDTEDGIQTYRIYYSNGSKGKGPFQQLIKAYRFFNSVRMGLKLIRMEWGNPDVVHVNILTRSGIPALYLKLFHNIPYLITEHWSRYMEANYAYSGFFRKLLTKVIVRHSSAITVVSPALKDSMIAGGLKNEYVIIPNVIDTENFIPIEVPSSTKKVFTHISCFEDKSKNISGLLHAAEMLSKERDDFLLNLVGEGADFNKMKQMSDHMGLTDKTVFFKGLLGTEALNQCINQSVATILYSNYETFGIVLLESMACGVPVISTRTGIMPEIYRDFMGMMIDVKNESQLIQAMNDFLNDKFKTDKSRLRGFVVENYSYDVVGKDFFKLYTKILKAG